MSTLRQLADGAKNVTHHRGGAKIYGLQSTKGVRMCARPRIKPLLARCGANEAKLIKWPPRSICPPRPRRPQEERSLDCAPSSRVSFFSHYCTTSCRRGKTWFMSCWRCTYANARIAWLIESNLRNDWPPFVRAAANKSPESRVSVCVCTRESWRIWIPRGLRVVRRALFPTVAPVDRSRLPLRARKRGIWKIRSGAFYAFWAGLVLGNRRTLFDFTRVRARGEGILYIRCGFNKIHTPRRERLLSRGIIVAERF